MVLAASEGGAGAHGAPRDRGERGSQTLEVALLLPLVGLLAVVVLHAGVLGNDLVHAQLLAREAARAAAIEGADAALDALQEAAGERPVELDLDPPAPAAGELVTARVRMRSAAFAAFGAEVWLPAQVTMRTETR